MTKSASFSTALTSLSILYRQAESCCKSNSFQAVEKGADRKKVQNKDSKIRTAIPKNLIN